MSTDIFTLPLEKGRVYVRERVVDIEGRSKRTVGLQRSIGEKNGNRGPRLGWIHTKSLDDGVTLQPSKPSSKRPGNRSPT